MRKEKQGWEVGGIKIIKDNYLILSCGGHICCLWGGQSPVEALDCESIDG